MPSWKRWLVSCKSSRLAMARHEDADARQSRAKQVVKQCTCTFMQFASHGSNSMQLVEGTSSWSHRCANAVRLSIHSGRHALICRWLSSSRCRHAACFAERSPRNASSAAVYLPSHCAIVAGLGALAVLEHRLRYLCRQLENVADLLGRRSTHPAFCRNAKRIIA